MSWVMGSRDLNKQALRIHGQHPDLDRNLNRTKRQQLD